MGRYIIIGDVHGCRRELDHLLDRLALQFDDRLFFVGDLVNKGPDSLGVLRQVGALLQCHPRSVCIAGNHEEKVLRLREAARPLPQWAERATADDWAFLESLPLYHRLPELGILLIHGGLYPAWFRHFGRLGEAPAFWRFDRSRRTEGLRRFLRVRRVREDGTPAPHRQATEHDLHWTAHYSGHEGFVYFGHDPQMFPPTPLVSPHAIGLDTGACYGGRLTAAVLEKDGAPDNPHFVSVPSQPYVAWRGPICVVA